MSEPLQTWQSLDLTGMSPSETIRPGGAPGLTTGDRAVQEVLSIATPLRAENEALRFGQTLGEGGMGIVRLAQQVSLGRQVAVKSIKPQVDAGAGTVKLLQEAWVTGNLEHPNVVPVYDLARDDQGRPYLILKRIEGSSWKALMADPETIRSRFGAKNPLDWNIRILQQVCNAIHFAHSKHILHRDLKPDNVMVGAFGEIYVLDWGIAVTLDEENERLPQAREQRRIAGTPRYMAPEQALGESDKLGPATDIYLLGAMLYEAVTGRPPHRGLTISEILSGIPSFVPSPEGVPDELVEILRTAMHADPGSRYASAEDLRQALQAFLEHQTSLTLSQQAAAELAQLKDLLADGTDDRLQDRAINDHYSRARFGFRAALDAWSGNEEAVRGQEVAIECMLRHAIATGDARRAAMLMDELPKASSSVVGALEALQRHQHAEAAELERLRRNMDADIGRRTRIFVMLMVGLVWTIVPALQLLGHEAEAYSNLLIAEAIMVVGIAGLAFWARDSMSKTQLNRSVMKTLVLAPSLQFVLTLGGWQYGVPLETLDVFTPFLWFAIATLASALIETRFIPTAVGYLAAFVGAVALPAQVPYFMVASNFVLVINALVVGLSGFEEK